MRRRKLHGCALACLCFTLAFTQAPRGLRPAAAGPRDGGTREAPLAGPRTGGLPPGHPPTGSDEEPDDDLPPGHPETGPAHAPRAQSPLPEDTSTIDKDLPPGTIVVEVRDASDRPVPRTDVTIGILQQSVAKGESRRRLGKQTDDAGNLRLDGLDFGGGVAYRVTVPWGGDTGREPATFAAPPFQLDLHNGQRVRVHVYPVTSRVTEAMLGLDGIIYMELKDDVVQFDEVFLVYNIGPVTWVPSDVIITLPTGFKGFVAQKEMSDAGWDEVPGRGAKLRGTFGPGQHETHFRYQVPYAGDVSIALGTTLPPQLARVRVMAEASKGMTLEAVDFPASTYDRNRAGQRILMTERQARAGEPIPSQLRISLDNIPTERQAKWIATAIAALTVVLGLYVARQQERGTSKSSKEQSEVDRERSRMRLVAEIAALDQARASGELGPKAYARIRTVLVDALGRLLATTA